MRTFVIDCAGCGAPLGGAIRTAAAGSLIPCLYCGALLRLGQGDAAAVVERTIPPQLVDRVREAALRGGRAEAIDLCVHEGGIEAAAANGAVDDIILNVASSAVFTQPPSAFGWLLISTSVACLAGGVAGLAVPDSPWWWVILPLLFGLLNLVMLSRGVVAAVRGWLGSPGSARIVRSVLVGPVGASGQALLYSLAVDVTPRRADVPPFHARLVVPVRAKSVGKVQVGQLLDVRFADGGAWLRVA